MTRNDLAADIAKYHNDPLRYALYNYAWGLPGELEDVQGPRMWQGRILKLIGDHLCSASRYDPLRIAVSSGHGVGKSALIAMVCGWAMSCYVDARVNVTANTGKQLDTKTWPEMAIWFRRMLNASFFDVKGESITVQDKSHKETWRIDAVPWSENNPAAFAGLHNKRKIVVLIMDEASEIPKVVWETSEGAMTDEETIVIFLAFGNPTTNSTSFSECFGSQKHRWHTFHLDSRQVEGTNKKLLDEWVADYGEDSDFVRVRVRGEFPRAGGNQFIPMDIVQNARKRVLSPETYGRQPKIISCDVARFGDDKTVIGLRQGMKWQTLTKLRKNDAVDVAGKLEVLVREHQARMVVIDGDGNGGPVHDILKKNMVNYFKQPERKLVEFHGGSTPVDTNRYYNRRAEVWGLMRDWLKAGADIPDEPELAADLVGPEYGFSGKNQIQLEKKDDMKRRGLSSPDDGDCCAMSFAFNAPAKTHREKLVEELEATHDPIQNYLIQLREHARVNKDNETGEWWK